MQNADVRVVDLAVVHPVDGFPVPQFFFGVGEFAKFVQGGIQEKVKGL